jgi:hypothetical protein
MDVFLPTALTDKGGELTNSYVRAFLRGEVDENGMTGVAHLAVEELLDEETWIKAGNKRRRGRFGNGRR